MVDILLGILGGVLGGWIFGELGIWCGGGMIGRAVILVWIVAQESRMGTDSAGVWLNVGVTTAKLDFATK